MTDPSGSTAFGYDARGRLVSQSTAINGVPDPYVVSRTYTPGSRMSSFTYPNGRTINYDRSSCMCSISKVTTTHNSVTKTLVDNLSYRPFGSAQGMGTGNGGTVSNIYDQNARLVVANPGAPKEQSYTYDANGNLTSITGASTPWFNRTYSYDALNRLAGASGSFGMVSYAYDKVGNRVSVNENGYADYYTYASGTNRLDSVTGANPVSYTYDANGNITGIGSRILTYNQNNRLIKVEEGGSILGQYTYNGLGQRVVKQVGANAIYFIYDFEGNLIAEAALDGSITVSYLYMGQNRMARVDTGTGKFYYYLNDSLGTPQMMTDETNTVVWEGLYKPFGEADVNPNSTVENNFRFPGQYYDSETGLHYNYYRFYDPKRGRYLTPDPIGLEGMDPNIYGYVRNNPVNSFDPQGLKEVCIPWFAKKSAWKEAWAYKPYWELTNENVILTGISGSCHWIKYKEGEKERKVTERELCWNWECESKKLYLKEGKTSRETKSFKDVIDTDVTPMEWVMPVGGYSWIYRCDRNFRSPILPDKE